MNVHGFNTADPITPRMAFCMLEYNVMNQEKKAFFTEITSLVACTVTGVSDCVTGQTHHH